MTNPFNEKNNRCKPFFNSRGEQYFLRIITTEATFRENPKVAEMLNRLATESEIDLAKEIAPRGERLKKMHKPEELWRATDSWISTAFGTPQNRTVFVIEDSKRNPISTSIMLIDSAEDRKKMRVSPGVGTFVYVTHAVTSEEWKGKGLFSLTLNKAISMLSNPKRNLPLPIDYSISVSAATALKADGSEINYVMNLPRYARMWSNRFEQNKLQVRLQSVKDGAQEGTTRHALVDFENKEKLKEESIH